MTTLPSHKEEPKSITIRFEKGIHLFLFRYCPGDEARLLEAITELVDNPRCNFGWRDASILCHFIGKNLAKDIKHWPNFLWG